MQYSNFLTRTCIADQLLEFHGWVNFKVYIDSKPRKYDLKLYGPLRQTHVIYWLVYYTLVKKPSPEEKDKCA